LSGHERPRGTFNPDGFSARFNRDPAHNPATDNLPYELEPVRSDFETAPRGYEFRRASYGLRRRRMPYFASSNPFASNNPFHRPNAFTNSPPDFFALKPPSALSAIKNPRLFDFGRSRGSQSSQFSSFSESGSGGLNLRGLRGRSGPFNLDAKSDGFAHYKNIAYRQRISDEFRGVGSLKASPVSPFIPGDHKFHDFYGSSSGSSGEGDAAHSAGSDSASAASAGSEGF